MSGWFLIMEEFGILRKLGELGTDGVLAVAPRFAKATLRQGGAPSCSPMVRCDEGLVLIMGWRWD